jgi:arsenical pump membrane protein
MDRSPERQARRISGTSWLAGILLVVGVACIPAGLLPVHDAVQAVRRTVPLLLFLAAVIVLAELLDGAQVFEVVATRMAIRAGGSYPYLFALCVALASLTTIFLNLDTTAVLLTPVMLAVAVRTAMPGLPLAMTTVWFANIASLLLPVSNLTNLLAADRVGLTPIAFAQRMGPPQLAAIMVGAGCLWACHWYRPYRRHGRYLVPEPVTPRDRTLFAIASVDAVLFVVLLLVGVPLPYTAGGCMVVLAAAFAVRRPGELRVQLIPFRLLVMVVGLFLVVGVVDRLGLGEVLSGLMGRGDSALDVARAAGVGAGLGNLINNLPAYVAGEAAVPVAAHAQLLGLLVGVNLGPLVTPWASLATLIWFERVRSADVELPIRRFVLTGAITAVLTLTASVAVLILTP